MAMIDEGGFHSSPKPLNYSHVQLVDMENFKLMLELDASLEVEIVPNCVTVCNYIHQVSSFLTHDKQHSALNFIDVEKLQGVDFVVVSFLKSEDVICTLQGWRRKKDEAC